MVIFKAKIKRVEGRLPKKALKILDIREQFDAK